MCSVLAIYVSHLVEPPSKRISLMARIHSQVPDLASYDVKMHHACLVDACQTWQFASRFWAVHACRLIHRLEKNLFIFACVKLFARRCELLADLASLVGVFGAQNECHRMYPCLGYLMSDPPSRFCLISLDLPSFSLNPNFWVYSSKFRELNQNLIDYALLFLAIFSRCGECASLPLCACEIL
jgi:hypothetical protein